MGAVSFCRHCGNQVNPQATVCLKCGCPPATGKDYCGNCGSAVKPEQAVCINCGAAISAATPVANNTNNAGKGTISGTGKSAGTATLLSCLIPGLGQIYLGQTMKGVVILIADLLLTGATAGVLGPVIWIVAMVDANKIGKRLENGETVTEWQFF